MIRKGDIGLTDKTPYCASQFRRKASQYYAVDDFVRFADEITDDSIPFAIVHVDHYFQFAFDVFNTGATTAFDWLQDPLLSLQQEEAAIILERPKVSVYRHYFIPHPRYLSNQCNAPLYRKLVLSVLHVALWHGVVAIVHFLSPEVLRSVDGEKVLQTTIFPGLKIACAAEGYHSGEYSGLKELSGPHLDEAAAAVRDLLNRVTSSYTIVYFDESFENKRLYETHRAGWQTLRQFYWDLGAPETSCYHCKRPIDDIKAMDLDHLVPVSIGGTNILTNLRPSHQRINRCRKDDPYYNVEGFDPGSGALTKALTRLYEVHARPHWVGRVQRPTWSFPLFQKVTDVICKGKGRSSCPFFYQFRVVAIGAVEVAP